MFDNLREQANSTPFDSTPFYEDEAQFEEAGRRSPAAAAPRRRPAAAASPKRLLGMTPFQRFILAFMLLIAVCALGSMLLLITDKIALF